MEVLEVILIIMGILVVSMLVIYYVIEKGSDKELEKKVANLLEQLEKTNQQINERRRK